MGIRNARGELPGVSAVIPNWNGEHLLAANLPHVIAVCKEYPGESEIIVVDDASDDRSVSLMRDRFAESVQVLQHNENKGFGAACWTGVQAARYPLVLLLNTDVQPLPRLIEPMTRYFAASETFAVSPLILSADGRIQNVSFRIPYLKRGRIHYRRWNWDKVLPRLPRPVITLWNSGGSMLVSREKFIELGGFDPIFAPFYREDADLGVRAWRHGSRCYVEAAAAVIHPAGSSVISTRFSKQEVRLVRLRNSLIFDVFHCRSRAVSPWVSLLLRCLRELAKGRTRAIACHNALKHLRGKQREVVGRLRQHDSEMHPRKIANYFNGYYGTRPSPSFAAVMGMRHRDRKKLERDTGYHEELEVRMVQRLRSALPDVAVADLGCGRRKFPGAVGIDLLPGDSVDIVHNLDEYPWPVDDDSFDLVIATHIAEHVRDFTRFLLECYRIVRPDGVLIVRCPHFSWRGSYSHPLHLRHLCYDSIGLMLSGGPDLSCGKVPFMLAQTLLRFQGDVRVRIGRALAARKPRSWEQYWSCLFPAREICWVLRKPARLDTISTDKAGA